MEVQFTITRNIDLPTIISYQKKHPSWTLEEIVDYYLDDDYSDENPQAIKEIQEAIEKEKE